MILEASLLIDSVGNEMTHITVAVWRPPGYKYLLRSPLKTIFHSFHSSLPCLGFSSLVLGFSRMEDKRGIKGEVCSHHPHSPVLEQGDPSETAPVVDLSSPQGEENPTHDIACDFEFAQRLFGELNFSLLGPPDDGKVIILSDSNEEEEEAHEEKSVGAEDAAASAAINLVSTASVDDIDTSIEKSSTPAVSLADANNNPEVEPNDSSDGLTLGPKVEEGTGSGDEASAP
jgi:hypothetical protein